MRLLGPVFVAALAVAAATGPPPIWILFVLAAALAGASAIERVVASAIVPKTVPPERLPAAIADHLGLEAGSDPEIEELKKDVAPEQVLKDMEVRGSSVH